MLVAAAVHKIQEKFGKNFAIFWFNGTLGTKSIVTHCILTQHKS